MRRGDSMRRGGSMCRGGSMRPDNCGLNPDVIYPRRRHTHGNRNATTVVSGPAPPRGMMMP
ncbi:MAG TPA: hypothetical protein VKP30_30890 [Polyangiaceae bacterium]|nr:hypothetical protein [Polyangiaceae bacterium]